MKKHFSFSRLLHNDKLMMIISLVLAIVIWAVVVYGQGYTTKRQIGGVVVSVALGEDAVEKNLRIVEGAEAKATVSVEGSRSAIGPLTAQDINVTADTSKIKKPGTYTIPITATASGDYDITNVVGADGVSNTITIVCDYWSEETVPLASIEVDMAKVTFSEGFKKGVVSIGGAAVQDGNVLVSGPQSTINSIDRLVAVVKDEVTLSEEAVFTADLVAYDAEGKSLDGITIANAEDSKVDVTVYVMQYHKEPLTVELKNNPENIDDRVTITPSAIELWADPAAIAGYVASVQKKLTLDFDDLRVTGGTIVKEIELEKSSSVEPVYNKVSIELDLSDYSEKVISLPVSRENIEILNRPNGYEVTLEPSTLANVIVCGPKEIVAGLKEDDLRVVVDVKDLSTGRHSVSVRISCSNPSVWIYYGESLYETIVDITKK